MRKLLLAVMCLSNALIFGQSIPVNRIVDTDFKAGSRNVEQADDRLTATNKILTGAWAEYKAGQAIMLTSGFEVRPGATFLAHIDNTYLSINKEIASDELKESLTAYPNPFEELITITYVLPKSTQVTLFISDEKGGIITRLVDGLIQKPGQYQIEWRGNALQIGKYFCVLDANQKRLSAPLVKK